MRVKNQQWFLYKKGRKNNQNIGNLEFERKKQELFNLIHENYNFLSTRGSMDELNERLKREEKIRLGNAFLTIYDFLANYVIKKNNQNNLSLLNQSNLEEEYFFTVTVENILSPIVSEILQQHKIEPNYYQKIIDKYLYYPWSLIIQIFPRDNIFAILNNTHNVLKINNIKNNFEEYFFKINEEILQQVQNNEYKSMIQYFYSCCLGEFTFNEADLIIQIINESITSMDIKNSYLIFFILEKISHYCLNNNSLKESLLSDIIRIYEILLKKNQGMESSYQKALDMKQQLDKKKAQEEEEAKKAQEEEEAKREIEVQKSIDQIWEITSQFIIE